MIELLMSCCIIISFNFATLDSIGRSDLEAVLTAMLETIFSHRSAEPGSASCQETVHIFLDAAKFSEAREGCTGNSMSFEDFRTWCTLLPSVRKFLGSLLMPSDPEQKLAHGHQSIEFNEKIEEIFTKPFCLACGSGSQVPRLLHPENIDSSVLLLREEYAWHIGGALSQLELDDWKLLYHSAVNGLSFNTFLGNISWTSYFHAAYVKCRYLRLSISPYYPHCSFPIECITKCRNDDGPTLLIIKDKEGYIYGGYASQPWQRHADFYGDMKSFLFQLYPQASIFRPTGANSNLQWCAVNFSSESIPNGIGFGGRINHFGMFLSANFDQGHTFSCITFGSPCMSKANQIYPEVIECWGVVPKGAQQERKNGVKGTVLERFKEDRNMLNMVGLANSSQ
ncbi:hypothetical protein RJ640_014128 [Escallonia rubra]|uniref:TLDc domain-containing protein n=1 Tax=Escallonia rubra TaxID=112253 RepID=A0AA88RTZ2_9ASTE|nr:hypothetical protein RJ640_014128 [Escallonia rubra]